MSHQPHESNWYVLVYDLQLEDPRIHLASGLSLRTLESPLSVFDLAAAGAAGFQAWATLEPFAPGCRCEIESALDAATMPGYDTLNRAWLVSAMLTLRGFGAHLPLACSSYSWNVVAGHQERTKEQFHDQLREEGIDAAVYSSKRELPPIKGNLLDYHLRLMLERDCRREAFGEEDASWIRGNFDAFNRLANESDKFRFALEAAVDWRYGKDPRAAISRIWGGIEAIFGISSELVFRISLLASALLAPRGDPRKKKFAEVKKLYGMRSKAVHGESLSSDLLADAMNDSYKLLRDILILIVEKGSPFSDRDLDEAVFG